MFRLIIGCLKKTIDFSSRADRREYWAWVLFWWVAVFFLQFLEIALGSLGVLQLVSALTGYFFIFFAVAFLPSLAVATRRLHDTGTSGWLLLIAVIPIFGPLILLPWLVRKGDPKNNRYGSPPNYYEEEIAIDETETLGQCSGCGEKIEIKGDAVFCPKCGRPI